MTPSWGGRTGANYTRSHRRGRLCPNRSQRRRSGARRPRDSQRDAGATSACGSQLSYSLCKLKCLAALCGGIRRRGIRWPFTIQARRKFPRMAIPATQLRPGMVIKHNNDLHAVFSVEHRTPGNLRAFIQAKLRNLRTGAMFEHRFRSADAIEKITVDEVKMEYLYTDGDNYYFMNTENYEQTYLGKDILGDAVDYLIPNLQIEVEFFDGKAVGVELPQTVDLTVVETEPGLKSATASSVTKPAKTETGLIVQVPPFINEGEKIRVDTSEGAYLSRA
jgi:elongation factor P